MNNLLLEINHRSKNMLAVIQSIANQTERHVTDIALFSRRLRGRIQSIARTQDLVTNSGWRGARLADVVAGEIRSGRMQRIATAKLEGADIVLSAEAAMHVGLALHELVVLAEEAGGADGMPPKIHSRLEDGGRQVEFRWEDCGSGGVSLGREDFQLVRLLLQRIVPQALSGAGTLDETPDGRFVYQLSFPLA
jgi:two-component sensor histidine kinase